MLNSSYDDKCPYTNGEMLVFASNRPGGKGGFDLYYVGMPKSTYYYLE